MPFDHKSWKLDYFEIVLELKADPVAGVAASVTDIQGQEGKVIGST